MPTDHARYEAVPPEKRWWDKPAVHVLYASETTFRGECSECKVVRDEETGHWLPWVTRETRDFEEAEMLGARHLREVHGVE